MAIGFNVNPVEKYRFGFGVTKLISLARIAAAVCRGKKASPIKFSAIERMLEFHKSSCTVHIYSGDRHCSCGRDEAVEEFTFLLIWLACLMGD